MGALVLAGLLLVGPAQGAADPFPVIVVHVSSDEPRVNGWYTGDVTVRWDVNPGAEDNTANEDGCQTQTVSLEGRTTIECTATNKQSVGGLSISAKVVIDLDKSAPSLAFSTVRPADSNGWYNQPVDFDVDATDAYSGLDSNACDLTVPPYSGPDRANAKVTATCKDMAGHTTTKSLTFDYDNTAPSIRAVPARAPDRYGWYSRAVRIGFAGNDFVSHMDRCSSQMYGRPNSANASVTGWCRDRAGNTRTRTFRFRFSSPLLQPRMGMRVTSPPLLDWVGVPRARGYNMQLWHDGRKILSRWPTSSQLRLDGSWRYQGRMCRLARGESYTWYVWPRFRHGYGKMLGSSHFAFVRGSSRSIPGLS